MESRPRHGQDLKWPVGLGATGNDGAAGQLKQTPGAIGYVELAFVKSNKLSTALVQNAAGQFVAPTADATTYSITSVIWLLVYRNPTDAAKSKQLSDFVRWALTDGQKEAAALDYAPLPQSLATRLVARLPSIGGAR